MMRDHVCLGPRGVTSGRGKFDEVVVSPGHRFSLKLRLVTAPGDQNAKADDWQQLLDLIADPALRIGGKTHRGFGSFCIHRAAWKLGKVTQSKTSALNTELYGSKITPETLWMIGGGLSADTDSAPISGQRIVWDALGKGSVQTVWIIPGSSIKGALAHRTRFHANVAAGNFIGEEKAKDIEPDMIKLFGTEKTKPAQAGRVFIDDIYLPQDTKQPNETKAQLAAVQNHVAINPFTGGAKDSALFDDQPLTQSTGAVDLVVQVRKTGCDTQPLIAAINDLCAGRLALGAHASRGYGIFTGTPIPI